jgi:hypothetical protein
MAWEKAKSVRKSHALFIWTKKEHMRKPAAEHIGRLGFNTRQAVSIGIDAGTIRNQFLRYCIDSWLNIRVLSNSRTSDFIRIQDKYEK